MTQENAFSADKEHIRMFEINEQYYAESTAIDPLPYRRN
jgi:hypothetical protein